MAERKKNYPCIKCSNHVKKNDKSVQCTLCRLWVHTTCQGITNEGFKILENAEKYGVEGMYWACTSCSAFSATFHQNLKEVNRRLDSIECQ